MTYSVEEVADRLAINDALIRYCHALDDHDYETLDTVFLDSCVIDLTAAGAMRDEWKEVKKFFRRLRDTCTRDMHFFGVSRITFTDARRESARVKSKVINPMGMIGEDKAEHFFQIHGSYEDLFVKTPEGWMIQERTWYHGWISGDYPFTQAPGEMRKEIAEKV
jgi:hypothetical protein